MPKPPSSLNTRSTSSKTTNSIQQSGPSVISENLTSDSKYIVSYIEDKFEKMQLEFNELLSSKNDEIDGLKTDVTQLNTRIRKLEDKLDEADAYQRRETVILSGKDIPAATPNENCNAVLMKLLQDKLDVNISENDVSTAHRLGRKRENVPDHRSLIVKFCRRDVKHLTIMASKQKKNPRLYVSESLTPTRMMIFNALKKMKQQHPEIVKGFSTYDGKVFAYTAPVNPDHRDIRHLVNSHETLIAFCREFIKAPLDLFLSTV